jgi:hypothetical protein
VRKGKSHRSTGLPQQFDNACLIKRRLRGDFCRRRFG